MPGLITHYICGEATMQNLSSDRKALLTANRALYNIGTQGPDIFFYDLPGMVRKRTIGLGSEMHRHNFRKFMENLLTDFPRSQSGTLPASISNEQTIAERSALAAYICGYITHYIMDCNAHPYIYYKSGFNQEGNKTPRYRYSVRHRNFETAIDVLMLNLYRSEKPSDKKLWQLIRVSRGEAAYVTTVLSKTIKAAYGTLVSNKDVYRAMACTIYATRLLQSRKGRRKRFIALIEDMTIGENLISSLIHEQSDDDGIDFLNIQKNPWHMPWDDSTEYRQSFTELFIKSVEDSTRMLNAFFDWFEGGLSLPDFLDLLGNNSFATGIDANEQVVFRYHDCVYVRE